MNDNNAALMLQKQRTSRLSDPNTNLPDSNASEPDFSLGDLTSDDLIAEFIGNADRQISQPYSETVAQSKSTLISRSQMKRLVLIGAGRVHLQLIAWWRERRIPGVELTLVTAFDQSVYRPCLPDALAGQISSHEITIDVPELCRRSGVQLLVDRVNGLQPAHKRISFAHHPETSYDLVSINLGSVPALERLWQSHRIMICVRPTANFISRFQMRFQELVEQWKRAPGKEMLQAVVVGGGRTGVEMAFALEQRRYDLELPIDVRLVESSAEILTGFPRSLIRKVRQRFHDRGIEMVLGSAVVDCDDLGPSELVLENGTRLRADLVIWAAGTAPSNAIREMSIAKTERGLLRVRKTFQSTQNGPIFAVGSAAEAEGLEPDFRDTDVTGQAELLLQNLSRSIRNEPLLQFQVRQDRPFSISCGDGTAITSKLGLAIHAGWVWELSHKQEMIWLQQFPLKKQ